MCVCMYVCIWGSEQRCHCMYECMCAYIHNHNHRYMIHTCICMIHTCICMIHTYIHTQIHTHIHTYRTAAHQLAENRYFTLPSHNISVSFMSTFGAWPMHGHLPPPCNSTLKATDRPASCSLDSLSRENVARNAHVQRADEWASQPYDFEGPPHEIIEKVHLFVCTHACMHACVHV
jgi:hypothetical protein